MNEHFKRIPTGITAVDNVLGGGLVLGGGYAIVGPPGFGKTTLALECVRNIPGALFVSNEQSRADLSKLCKRVDVPVAVLGERGAACEIVAYADRVKARVLVLDTVQTTLDDSNAEIVAAGTHPENQRVMHTMMTWRRAAKGRVVIVLAHSRRDDSGPIAVEAMSDVVVYLYGDTDSANPEARVLSVVKHRFGPPAKTTLRMSERGFRE